jgi:hypothetical protein
MGSSLRAHRRRIAHQRHRERRNAGTQARRSATAAARTARRPPALPGRRRAASIAGALFLVAAAGSQLAVPPLITAQLRARLQQIGTVRSLSVSAFPAVEALWGHLDSVRVHLGRVNAQKLSGGGAKSSLAAAAAGVTDASIRADQITLQHPVAQDLNLQKKGSHLRLSVLLDPATIGPVLARSLGLPPGTGVQLTADRSDPVLLISSPRFGGTVQLRLLARDGTLAGQIQPTPAMAAQLGLPAGISPPPQVLLHTKTLTLSELAATTDGGRLRLTANGQVGT